MLTDRLNCQKKYQTHRDEQAQLPKKNIKTHRDGQFYDAKWSKILFNYKRYSRIAKRFIVFQNFVPKNLKFFKILLLVASRWYIFSWLIISWLIVNVGWWLVGC